MSMANVPRCNYGMTMNVCMGVCVCMSIVGPYQVVEITLQGAVRIATLDGVVMEGYINGSKLKRFYGPLTLLGSI